jgi:hypothetical protein
VTDKTAKLLAEKMQAAIPPEDVGPFRSPDNQLFCRLGINGHYEHWPLDSDYFRRWVRRELFLRTLHPPSKQK